MKRVKQFILTILMVLGITNISAQTMMNAEDINYYLENHTDTILFNQIVAGSYDGEMGAWVGFVSRTTLPSLEETIPLPQNDPNYDPDTGSPMYGIMVFISDPNINHWYVYDYGIMFPYHSAETGSLYYDGTGILQYLQDPILDLGEDEEFPTDYIFGAYFMCGDIFELFLGAGPNIRLVIYQ